MYERDVEVLAEDVRLAGTLTLPERPRAAIAFAHGSGSSRSALATALSAGYSTVPASRHFSSIS